MGLLELAKPALTHLSNPLEGWQEIPIDECNEPLVELTGTERVHVWPVYHRRGYRNAGTRLWLREGLVEPLHQAGASLPAGYSLLVLDAWRSTPLQGELYGEYRALLQRETGLTGAALETLVRRFISAASDDPLAPSPHATGACVDVALFYEGGYLDIGAQFDEMSDRNKMDYYERPDLIEIEMVYRDRRRVLQDAMEEAGWVDYPAECWHFSIGDQMGTQPARMTGQMDLVARYGIIEPLAPSSL